MVSVVAGKRRAGRRYLLVALLVVILVAVTGWLLDRWMTGSPVAPLSGDKSISHADNDLDTIFSAAVTHMQQGRYPRALDLWHQAMLINPDIPEVKVNMGFTLFELGSYKTAREFFIDAMEQDAYQANAYYGLAITSEKMGDLEGALGAMRSYIHLAGEEQEQKFIRRARSALWEWEAKLSEQSADESLPEPVGEPAGRSD